MGFLKKILKMLIKLFGFIWGIGIIYFSLEIILGFEKSVANTLYDAGGGGILNFIVGVLIIYTIYKSNEISKTEKYASKYPEKIPNILMRLSSYLIDSIIIVFFYVAFTLILELLDKYIYFYISNNPLVILLPCFFLYYILFEYFFGTTLGKMLFKLKITSTIESINNNDKQIVKTFFKPKITQIIFRCFMRCNMLNIFKIFSKNPIFLHDKFSDTIPIKTKP